jgi:hypothetical protein
MTPEQAKAKLWKFGQLSWLLRPEQQNMLQMLYDSKDLAVFNISRRLGKSTTCATFCVENAIRKKQHIRYATAFLSDLEQFICPIFEWVMESCPESLRPQWLASKKEYRFKNGSVIKLIGLDKNPNGLRGNAVDILVVDEAAFVSNLEYLYKSIIVPATMKRQFKLIFPSTPPESPEHFWSRELIFKAQERGTYIELTIDAISDLPADERKRLLDEVGGEFSATAQREFFCKIVVDVTRSIAPSFKDDLHIKEFDPPHIQWGFFGDGGGVRDMTVFYKAGYDHTTRLTLFREEMYFPRNTETSKIIQAFKERWGDKKTIMFDVAGQLAIDWASAGLPTVSVEKDEFDAGIRLLNNEFHLNRVVIHPDCKLLIRTLKGGLLNKQRTDFERTEALGHCDAAAAFIYGLRGVDKTTDLRPKPKGEDIFRPKQEDPLTNTLAKMGW